MNGIREIKVAEALLYKALVFDNFVVQVIIDPNISSRWSNHTTDLFLSLRRLSTIRAQSKERQMAG